MAEVLKDTQALESTTVGIFRTATVVKGGRRFSFAALVVVGDRKGKVGIGYGKAPSVPAAIEKAQKDAKKSLHSVTLKGGTLPHPTTGRFASSKVRLLPAAPGTGVIAGGTVRAVLEMAGVHDCLTKAYGSSNKKNLCKAVMEGLKGLQSKDEVARLRGVELGLTEVEQKLEAGRRYLARTSEKAAGDKGTTKESAKPETTDATTSEDKPKAEAAKTPGASGQETDAQRVDTPKEQVSKDATTEQPQPEASDQQQQGESEEESQS